MLPKLLSERPACAAKQVAGQLCLDFANLTGGWQGIDAPRDDRLTQYGDLLAWAWRAGTLDGEATARLWDEARRRPGEAEAVLRRARCLRNAIHALAFSLERGSACREPDLDVLAQEARLAWSRRGLRSQRGRLAWRLEDDPRALDSPLWSVALSAEDYFTRADLTRLHSCPGEDCGWHFEDRTRNRSRQWCDMGDCGNVAKVRRFRARQRGRKRRVRGVRGQPRT
ncbi:MAG TPA: CGNR zinc finger domain-containing protein [Vicinamibacteria bacterium]|nr:CGNR zinc finger domain-containing protein [Vicinamibacteria bacterium]